MSQPAMKQHIWHLCQAAAVAVFTRVLVGMPNCQLPGQMNDAEGHSGPSPVQESWSSYTSYRLQLTAAGLVGAICCTLQAADEW